MHPSKVVSSVFTCFLSTMIPFCLFCDDKQDSVKLLLLSVQSVFSSNELLVSFPQIEACISRNASCQISLKFVVSDSPIVPPISGSFSLNLEFHPHWMLFGITHTTVVKDGCFALIFVLFILNRFLRRTQYRDNFT